MSQPLLESPRLWLRPAGPQHVEAMHACWSHPLVRRFLFDDQPVTRENAAQLVADSVSMSDRGLGLWVLERKATGREIGCVALRPLDLEGPRWTQLNGLPEPVVALLPAYWKQGFAVESLRTILGCAFNTFGHVKIVAVTDAGNRASAKMLTRVGFEPQPSGKRDDEALNAYHLVRGHLVS